MNSMHTANHETTRATLGDAVADPFFAEGLFDALPDVVFFVKDGEGRYVVVNQTLVQRCGQRHKSALIGRTPAEVFAHPFGQTYHAQDLLVLAGDNDIEDQLELHLYPNRDPGWCLTRKTALRDAQGRIVGLTGISRDLAMADKKNPAYRKRDSRTVRPALATAGAGAHREYVGGADRALLPAHLPPDAAPDDYPDARGCRFAHAERRRQRGGDRASLRLRRPFRFHAPVQGHHRADAQSVPAGGVWPFRRLR
jgi:hypothetical protein